MYFIVFISKVFLYFYDILCLKMYLYKFQYKQDQAKDIEDAIGSVIEPLRKSSILYTNVCEMSILALHVIMRFCATLQQSGQFLQTWSQKLRST